MSTSELSRPLPSLTFRRVRALVLLLALIVLITGVVHLARAGIDHLTATAPTAEVTSTAPQPPTAKSATAALTAAVARANAGSAGRLAVVVTDLDTGTTAAVNADEPFTAASIVKVDILAALLLQSDGTLEPSERRAAARMIQVSDNRAATTLWKQIGGVRGLAEANQQLGLTATVGASRGRWGVTSTTAADQARLLAVIFTDDSPLPASSRRYARSLLGHIAPDQDWGISSADTRPGTKFHVKNGWLPRTGGWVVNSTGTVEHDGHRLLLVALSDGRKNKDAGVRTLELVARDAARVVTGS